MNVDARKKFIVKKPLVETKDVIEYFKAVGISKRCFYYNLVNVMKRISSKMKQK